MISRRSARKIAQRHAATAVRAHRDRLRATLVATGMDDVDVDRVVAEYEAQAMWLDRLAKP